MLVHRVMSVRSGPSLRNTCTYIRQRELKGCAHNKVIMHVVCVCVVLTSGSIAGRVGLVVVVVVVGSILVRQIDPGARVVMMMIYLKTENK